MYIKRALYDSFVHRVLSDQRTNGGAFLAGLIIEASEYSPWETVVRFQV